MNKIAKLTLVIFLFGMIVPILFPLCAQDTETTSGNQVTASAVDRSSDLTVAEVEKDLAALEADTGIESAIKDLLRPQYKQAIDSLKAASKAKAKAVEYRDAMKSAPEQTANLRDQLKELPPVEDGVASHSSASTEDLQKEATAGKTSLAEMNDALEKVSTVLANTKGRIAENGERLAEAQKELAGVVAQLESPESPIDTTSPGQVVGQLVLKTSELELQVELEMLRHEQLSQTVREDLLKAQQELLNRQIENKSATLKALETLVGKRLTMDAKLVGSLAKSSLGDVPQDDQESQELAIEVQALAKQLENVIANLEQISAIQDDVSDRGTRLSADYDTIREQLQLGSSGRAMAKVLFGLRQQILKSRSDQSGLMEGLPTMDLTSLAAIEIDTQLGEQPDVIKRFADHSSEAVQQLVDARGEVLKKLKSQHRKQIRSITTLDIENQKYQTKSKEVLSEITDQLFWMRSSPPVTLTTLSDLPNGLKWVFSREHGVNLWETFREMRHTVPLAGGMVVLVSIVLLLLRRRFRTALLLTGEKIRRISTDRFSYTVEALLWTVLLAVPIPLLIGFLGWGLGQAVDSSDWTRSFAAGLQTSSVIVLGLVLLAVSCRKGGLGAAHFRWPAASLTSFRRAIFWFGVVYIPAILLLSSTLIGDNSNYFDGVGRVSLMLAHIWTSIVLWRMSHFSNGFLTPFLRENPTRLLSRWRHLFFAIVVGSPIALVVLAAFGYSITAIELSFGFLSTMAVVASGVILYWLTSRWFMVKKRKLRLAEALERRKARLEAADSDDSCQDGEIVTIDSQDEANLNLNLIGDQTRDLLRSLFGLGVFVVIVLLWSETFPIVAAIDSVVVPLTGGLTLLGFAKAALIIAVTWTVVQNFPGLLELSVLRTTSIEVGTRYAIAKLCQYAIIAIGFFFLFGVLKVDWTKFGWIAAALSVGLGFGLQEVVANFVCGLILLFERPIRVGDVVTVDTMTGTVTRIQMRATTITNWDRQEFVVPNKNLITNTILNWTLTASINRVVIPVGVAYGTDTAKARRILLDVATENPFVLEEPMPMTSFDEFADSTLTLTLRAYLPDLDNRLKTISELHAEIDKRFATAGIEIAFPQRDLNLRSGWKFTGPAGARDANEQSMREAHAR